MYFKRRSLLGLLLIVLFLQGCIGISTISKKDHIINYPKFQIFSKTKKPLFKDLTEPLYYTPPAGYVFNNYDRYYKEDILILWGEPDNRYKKDGYEYWRYKKKIGFSGIMVYAIIPIPLLLPSRYRYVTLVFKKETLNHVINEYGGQSYGLYCRILSCTTEDPWESFIKYYP